MLSAFLHDGPRPVAPAPGELAIGQNRLLSYEKRIIWRSLIPRILIYGLRILDIMDFPYRTDDEWIRDLFLSWSPVSSTLLYHVLDPDFPSSPSFASIVRALMFS